MNMLSTRDYIALEDEYIAHNYRPLDVIITRAEGAWVWDTEGRKYLDCLSAHSALNQGHCHPRIVRAMLEQAQRLALTSQAFYNDQLPLLAEELCELTGYEMVLPMNSGTEAVDTALKAVRKWGYTVKGVPDGQAEIIACDGNFHGRTVTVITFSPEEQYRDSFGPFMPGFKLIPYADAEALERAITPNTVAFLFEPIQGEGGVVVPPKGYMRDVREICTEHKVLMVADEIQTGLGRTGKLLACEHEGVRSDVVTLGKALSGGMYPVSVVLASREVLGSLGPGDHDSILSGSPLACAVAREALQVIVDENLCQRAAELGDYFITRLQAIESPYVALCRGKGLLIGIVLKPQAGSAHRFCEALKKRGVLTKETHGNVMRLAPPLIVTREELDWALERIEDVLCDT
jgi:ornithine--oxo-acid transaminase